MVEPTPIPDPLELDEDEVPEPLVDELLELLLEEDDEELDEPVELPQAEPS